MTDLVYFGYDWEDDSRQFEIDFKKEIKEKFADVELRNANDQIKGYRQEVLLSEDKKNDYYAWLLGKGWFEMSLSMQLMMMTNDKEPKERLKVILDLAKQQYPQSFKSEA